ncbi:MAG: sulfotransferase [Nocardioides sp.]
MTVEDPNRAGLADEKDRRGAPAFTISAEPRTDTPRTYIIVGSPRGGTSMVAGLASICGLRLGTESRKNQEDPEFNLRDLRQAGKDPIPSIRDTIDRRNAEHPVWGWKFPRAIAYLDQVRTALRSPHFIIVSRDPVASAGRRISQGIAPVDAITERLELMLRNIDLVTRWGAPALVVSYERTLQKPMTATSQIADFLGMAVPTDPAHVHAFIQPGSYRHVP